MKHHSFSRLLMAGVFFLVVLALSFSLTFYVLHTAYRADLSNLEWQRPTAFLLLFLIPLGWWLRRVMSPRNNRVRVAIPDALRRVPAGPRVRFAAFPQIFLWSALCLMILALAGPRSPDAHGSSELEGIDIVLALDMSGSMKDPDIAPTRFQATQAVVDRFVANRPNDRIGVVVFGKDAFTLLPLTTDKSAVREAVTNLQLGAVDGFGTAIGNAVATSLNRLRHSDAKSRIVILLTDGSSTAGDIFPEQATELAHNLKIPVFTILMGATADLRRVGSAAPINPELLRSMASRTGGEFYKVTDKAALRESFHSILDKLEKSRLQEGGAVYTELYPAFLLIASLWLMLNFMLESFVFRRFP